MNIPRLLALANLIEKQPHVHSDEGYEPRTGFSMAQFLHTCGTPSCIAGWAAAMEKEDPAHTNLCQIILAEGPLLSIDNTVQKKVQTYLGLDTRTADRLFMPITEEAYADLTPAQAAATLRHLAATGEVKW